jgi:hypothetical protein
MEPLELYAPELLQRGIFLSLCHSPYATYLLNSYSDLQLPLPSKVQCRNLWIQGWGYNFVTVFA